jgi:acyl-coenzyme A synthetase/AMP-(fatty) acid ligase
MHSANLPAGTISLILDEHGEWMGDLMSDTTIQQTPLPDEESLTADDLAYLVYSSGTTGKPKGEKQTTI